MLLWTADSQGKISEPRFLVSFKTSYLVQREDDKHYLIEDTQIEFSRTVFSLKNPNLLI